MFSASKTGAGASGYPIVNSLRFQSASSQYLTRTPASAGNQKTWTYSTWLKRGAIGTIQAVFDSVETYIQFNSTDIIEINLRNAGTNYIWTTSQVFRDPGAWYHIVLAVDTTQATATNRMKLYVNGSQVTAFASSATIPQNTDTRINSTSAHYIGSYTGIAYYLDGYQAEINFVNAQQLTPSSFGETNSTTGQWIAKSYSGSYGTNGFYLKFANGTSTTTLGSDSSGNGNNWTLNNFTRSAGVSDCWMIDVPSGNSGASAVQPSSNYAVLNPLSSNTVPAISNANLQYSGTKSTTNSTNNTRGTIGMSSGKWYWECVATTDAAGNTLFGIQDANHTPVIDSGAFIVANGYAYEPGGTKKTGTTSTSYGASWGVNDIIGVALDMDAGTLTFYKNGVSQGVAFSGITGTYVAWLGFGISTVTRTIAGNFNFGQRSFAYTPPSGFKALCTANLPTSSIVKGNQYMDATLYTGNGTTGKVVTNAAGFAPDFVWIKDRSAANYHGLFDVIRGAGYALYSNGTFVESAFNAQTLQSFNSNGFTVGTNGDFNTNTNSYVGWQWDAGSSTVTNTSGTISSQVRANPTAGVSVVTYTGTGANATVGHGLGVAPKMVIAKTRTNVVGDWMTWHTSLTSGAYYLKLNATNAQASAAGVWNSTTPTSTVFSVGTDQSTNYNSSTTYVAYCFAEIAGFSKFGSYTGNGSADGPFVYCGFRPKYVLIKNSTSGTGYDWEVYDSVRGPYNLDNQVLYPDLTQAEATPAAAGLDLLSNGFKIRFANGNNNPNGATMIYMAFAENPFAQANAR